MNRLNSVELFLFDMDGTLYLGDKLFDFTVELLEKIKQSGRKYLFMTNNSARSVSDYVKKLDKLGIKSSREDFITSSQATAYYIKREKLPEVLYVCGTKSLKDELSANGFTITDDVNNAETIVMGNDWELDFKKLYDISYILTKKDIPYIATNPDYVCPTEWGFVPDCGSVCDMIFNATGKRPVFIGKPSPLMPVLGAQKSGVDIKKCAVVGDRIYTDVKSGINAGALGVLVLSGESDIDTVIESDVKPDIILNDAGEIMQCL